MKAKAKLKFLRWMHLFLIFFVGLWVPFLLMAGLAFPFFRWFLHETPYSLPSGAYVGRMTLAIFWASLVAGSIAWYFEKRQAGR